MNVGAQQGHAAPDWGIAYPASLLRLAGQATAAREHQEVVRASLSSMTEKLPVLPSHSGRLMMRALEDLSLWRAYTG